MTQGSHTPYPRAAEAADRQAYLMNPIKIRYLASDGARSTRSYKTLAGARKYAHLMIGAHPEMGSYYAISGDGVGRVTVQGATLADIFPEDDQRSEDGDGARRGSEWS